MRRFLTYGILALAVLTLSVSAGAVDTGVILNLEADYVEGCFVNTQIGWVDGVTTNGYDNGWDYAADNPCQSGVIELDLINSSLGSGRWMDDFRLPLSPTADRPIVWLMKAYIPLYEVHQDVTFGMKAWFQPGFELPSTGFLADKSFAAYEGDVRTTWATRTALWYSPHGVTGSFASPNWQTGRQRFLLPDGGSRYFTIVIAPEPGSMLAILTGLAGLVFTGLRRKR